MKQRKLINSRTFLIKDDGLEWTIRENFNYQSTFFEFEEMNFKKSTKLKKYNLALIILAVLSIIALILSLIPGGENEAFDSSTILIFAVLSGIFLVLTYFLRTDNIYIPTDRGAHIIMYNGLPNKKKFSEFLKTLKSEAKNNLIEKYSNENTDQEKLYLFLEERGLVEKKDKEKFGKNIKIVHNKIKGFGKD
ncbi:hypothetical protein [Christiangramia echinicola]|uniref:Uncharacterized protein n=1 Tax=Christiangramia echinicola TaxID=279359 RepID=A0A1H1L9B8_9FLAO|nr:hypothetical protein [Christiangramia echinicola]SDR71096.1 hypothetical protein SAMN04488552_0643 [Christiangramia echinicola]